MATRHGILFCLLLALGGCEDPAPLPMDFVRALDACPPAETNCVLLQSEILDPSLYRGSRESGSSRMEFETTVVGRFPNGHWRRLRLLLSGAADPAWDDGFAVVAAIGPTTIVTTHGPLELIESTLDIVTDKRLILLHAASGEARWVPGPIFDTLYFSRTRRPDDDWPAFFDGVEPVWLIGNGCFRLSKRDAFVRLPIERCRPAALDEAEDEESRVIDEKLVANGFDLEELDRFNFRVGVAPYYLRLERGSDVP